MTGPVLTWAPITAPSSYLRASRGRVGLQSVPVSCRLSITPPQPRRSNCAKTSDSPDVPVASFFGARTYASVTSSATTRTLRCAEPVDMSGMNKSRNAIPAGRFATTARRSSEGEPSPTGAFAEIWSGCGPPTG